MPVYPILDTAWLGRHSIDVAEAVKVCLDAGVHLVQIRHKGEFDREFVKSLETCAALGESARIVLNDRADYAKLLGFGLHVGQEDLPVKAARGMVGETAVVGLSTHNERQFEAALLEAVSYVALGPIFQTASKDNADPVVGVAMVRALRPLTELPMVASHAL